MATDRNYRMAIMVGNVGDEINDNAESLYLGDFLPAFAQNPMPNYRPETGRLIFVKDRYGSKTVLASDITRELIEFIKTALEINTVDSTGKQPKITFIVVTNDDHNLLDKNIIRQLHEKLQRDYSKLKPFILNMSSEGIDYEVTPIANANAVFTTMTLRTGTTPETLANLVVQLVEQIEKSRIDMLQLYRDWIDEVFKRIDLIQQSSLEHDRRLADVMSTIGFYENYRQAMADYITEMSGLVGNKPYRYTIDTRSLGNVPIFIRLRSNNTQDTGILNAHIWTNPSLTSGLSTLEDVSLSFASQNGRLINFSKNGNSLGNRGVLISASLDYTFRIQNGSVYHLWTETPHLNIGVVAASSASTFPNRVDHSSNVVHHHRLGHAGNIRLAVPGKNENHIFAPINNSGTDVMNNMYIYHSSGGLPVTTFKMRTSKASGVLNIRIYDTNTGRTMYVPLTRRKPAFPTIKVTENQTNGQSIDWYMNRISEFQNYGAPVVNRQILGVPFSHMYPVKSLHKRYLGPIIETTFISEDTDLGLEYVPVGSQGEVSILKIGMNLNTSFTIIREARAPWVYPFWDSCDSYRDCSDCDYCPDGDKDQYGGW